MGDTYGRVSENIVQHTYNLKAKILLEYAWYSELRIMLLPTNEKFVLPYKIIIDAKEDDSDNIGENLEDLQKTMGKIDLKLNEMAEKENNLLNLEEKLNKIMDKLDIKY